MVKKSNVSRRERRVKRKPERKEQIKLRRIAHKRRQQNKRIFNYTLMGLVVIAIITAFYLLADNNGEGEHDNFARCIASSGAIMYGTDWCPHCQDQKQLFGKSFRYVNYVNCDLNGEACTLAGVKGYPTWVYPNGDAAPGVQALDILAERTGCTYES